MSKREVLVLPIFRAKGIKKSDHVVSTVSHGSGWQRDLSPFVLGPCELYDGLVSRNMENAWQFSKVYKEHLNGKTGEPRKSYWAWAKESWADQKAHRYPMGKGRAPIYSYWDGEKLGYIDARKRIYGPLYIEAVQQTEGWKQLQKRARDATRLILLDYDAYDHRALGMTLTDVLNNPERKMGHAFLLAMLLTKDKALNQLELR